jgi:DNA-binding NarL/FixJ family response regulator
MKQAQVDLRGARILVLEDDYYVATDLQAVLEDSGAQVVGPFADAADALSAIEREQPDCALVDINLGQGPSFDLPRALTRENVPFAFVTGYDALAIPTEFKMFERLEKPHEACGGTKVARRLLSGD